VGGVDRARGAGRGANAELRGGRPRGHGHHDRARRDDAVGGRDRGYFGRPDPSSSSGTGRGRDRADVALRVGWQMRRRAAREATSPSPILAAGRFARRFSSILSGRPRRRPKAGRHPGDMAVTATGDLESVPEDDRRRLATDAAKADQASSCSERRRRTRGGSARPRRGWPSVF